MLKPMTHQTTHTFVKLRRSAIVAATVGIGFIAPTVSAVEMQAANSEQSLPTTRLAQNTDSPTLPNGTYLYGETSTPDQIGSAYMVFQVEDAQVTGAFYLPHSSFDCFQGQFQGDRLSLTVVDSYSQTPHDYSLAVQANQYLASATHSVAVPVQIDGYQPIAQVSENDQRMLETCKADFQ
jgi:hypothetical protein